MLIISRGLVFLVNLFLIVCVFIFFAQIHKAGLIIPTNHERNRLQRQTSTFNIKRFQCVFLKILTSIILYQHQSNSYLFGGRSQCFSAMDPTKRLAHSRNHQTIAQQPGAEHPLHSWWIKNGPVLRHHVVPHAHTEKIKNILLRCTLFCNIMVYHGICTNAETSCSYSVYSCICNVCLSAWLCISLYITSHSPWHPVHLHLSSPVTRPTLQNYHWRHGDSWSPLHPNQWAPAPAVSGAPRSGGFSFHGEIYEQLTRVTRSCKDIKVWTPDKEPGTPKKSKNGLGTWCS